MMCNGSFFGINVFGNITETQIAKGMEIVKTVEKLRQQLSELFDERVADMIISKLGEAAVELKNENIPHKEAELLERLSMLGIIGKAKL